MGDEDESDINYAGATLVRSERGCYAAVQSAAILPANRVRAGKVTCEPVVQEDDHEKGLHWS